MKILKSKRLRRVLSIVLTVAMIASLVTYKTNNVVIGAGYDATNATGIVKNILEAMGSNSAHIDKGFAVVQKEDEESSKGVRALIGALVSEETGGKNMLVNLMTGNKDGSITIGGKEIDFSAVKNISDVEEIPEVDTTSTESATMSETESITEVETVTEEDANIEEPVIVVQPQDVTTSIEKSVELSVEAVGNNVAYSWEFSSDGGNTWNKIDNGTATTITFESSFAKDGKYRCVVTDENGKSVTSDVATVTIEVSNAADSSVAAEKNVETISNMLASESTDLFSYIPIVETGFNDTVINNLGALDKLITIKSDDGTMTVSQKWTNLTNGIDYENASYVVKSNAVAKLLSAIINKGYLNEEVTVAINYDNGDDASDNDSASFVIKNTCKLTVVNKNGDESYTKTIVKGTTFGDVITTNPTRAGYTFAKWQYDNGNEINATDEITADITATAVWEANDTEYKIQVYKMGLDGEYSDTDMQEIDAKGKTDSEVSVGEIMENLTDKNIDTTGFSVDEDNANSGIGKTIAADGTTVVAVYCIRNKYKLTYDSIEDKTEEYYFGAKIDEIIPADVHKVVGDEYSYDQVFVKWMYGDDIVNFSTFTMPAKDVTIVAQWELVSSLYIIEQEFRLDNNGVPLFKKPTSEGDSAVTIKPNDSKDVDKILKGEDEEYTKDSPIEILNTGKYNFDLSFVFDTTGAKEITKKTDSYKFVFNVDVDEPTFNVNEEPIEWTNTNIEITNISDEVDEAIYSSGISSVIIAYRGTTEDVDTVGDVVLTYTDSEETPILDGYTVKWDNLAEGEQDVTITVTDVAGNATEKKVHVLKDTTAPEVVASQDIIEWEKTDITFTISNVESNEVKSDIDSVVISYMGIDENGNPTPKTLKDFEDIEEKYTILWDDLAEGEQYITITVTDEAGKTATTIDEVTGEPKPVYVKKDTTRPDFDTSEDIEWKDKNKDVVISGIEDPVSNTVASGIKTVTIIYADTTLELAPANLTLEENTTEDENAAPSYSYVIKWDDLPEGEYNIEINVIDMSNLNKAYSVSVQKDITAPVYTSSSAIIKGEGDDENVYWANDDWAEANVVSAYVEFSNITYANMGNSAYRNVTSPMESYKVEYVYEVNGVVNREEVENNEIETDEAGNVIKVKVPWTILPDGDYHVELTVVDEAGNTANATDEATGEFDETKAVHVKKDTIAPNFDPSPKYDNDKYGIYEWTNDEGIKKADVVFAGICDPNALENVVGDATSGFEKDDIVIEYVYYDSEGKEVIVPVPESDAEYKNNAYTIKWERLPEGSYYVRLSVTDNAGNNKTKAVKVQKDITNPSLTITATGSVADADWNADWDSALLGKSVDFLKFSNSAVKVTLDYADPKPSTTSVNENRSGIVSVGYALIDKAIVTEEELINYTAWTETYNAEGKSTIDIDTTVDTSRNAIVYVKVVDAAGNVTYGSTNGIIVDRRDPKPEITIDIPESQDGYYNSTVPVTYKVTDPATGEAYSGLKSVTYEIINEDNKANKVEQTTPYDAAKHVQTTNDQKVDIDGTKFNSNNVVFKVTAVDNAGNTVEKSVRLQIDTTAPAINVSYASAAHQGKYYRENRVATITITERNFDPSAVTISITKDGANNSRLANVTWTKTAGTGNGDNTKHVATITYSADADYTFDIKCTDLAGNDNSAVTYTGGHGKKFTVDKTLPVVTVSYDESPSNGMYYDTGIKITVVIKEHNFDASAAKLTTTGASNVGSFTKTGTDEYTAIISYMNEAECKFDIEFSDQAGNAAKYNGNGIRNKDDYPLDEFVIDMTAPKDIVFDTAPNSANNSTVTASFNFKDDYFSDSANPVSGRSSDVEVSIVGYKNGDVTSSFPFTLSTSGGKVNVTFNDFPREMQWDDVYTVTTTVTDLAGNETSGEIVFSVNRFGSNYVFGTSTEELVNNYYTNTPQDIDVFEISASTGYVEDYTISLIINGERRELVEGEDFSVDHNWKVEYPEDYSVRGEDNIITVTGEMLKEVGASASNGWKINHYTIFASNFDTEGEYTIIISSTDTAGNSMASNTSKYENSKNVSFVYDVSTPDWYINNASDNKQYKGATYDFEIAVSDGISNVNKVEIIYKGNTTVYEAENIVDGYITFTAKESYGWQELKLVVYDQAGNITEETVQFSLSSNAFIQFFALNWMYILIGLGIVAAGVIVVIILKKRKKDDEEKVKTKQK